jgi:hypothetical protein
MKITNDLTKTGVRSMLEDNKELLVPLGVVLAAILLFIIVVLPQIMNFPAKKSERDVEVARLTEIKQAKEILQSLDRIKLDSDLKIADSALPSDKNFEIILNAISAAASLSNSQITDYKYSQSGPVAPASAQALSGLNFEIEIEGEIDQAVKFIDELYKTYPISEAKKIDYDGGISKVSLVFYYNPFTTGVAKEAALARDSSPAEKKALAELSKWNINTIEQDLAFPIYSTSSGVRTSPF